MKRWKALPADANGPRFRIVRVCHIAGEKRVVMLGSADTPGEAMTSVFAEPGWALAIDRRGDVFADNHHDMQECE